MLNLIQRCAPWLNWKSAGIIALLAFGAAFCLGMPTIGLLAGAAPILLIIACLIPCLIPLALLHDKNRSQTAPAQPMIPLTEQAGASCACGQNACGVGGGSNTCQSKRETHS